MTLRGKRTFFGSNVRVTIDGKDYSPQSFVQMAKDRGVNLSVQAMTARMRSGITSIDAMLAPPNSKQQSSRKSHSRKKAEMAELLATLGPPRRY